MIADEPAFASLLPAATLRRVWVAAIAMCRSRDPVEADQDACPCEPDTNAHCIAFGLYGDMALAVIEALDADQRN